MEKRKLTKEDIDKVRYIEGFPIGSDDDIIALSEAPYYTACPNPFINEFLSEFGKSYDESTDDYHREPFAADVSEGKSDIIYNVHSYHTKVPHKAIMRYILHYTQPGDIVYDSFGGSGMTGVAAQMCGDRETVTSLLSSYSDLEERVGARKAIISDLSPAATFTALNYNYSVNTSELRNAWDRIYRSALENYGWMLETNHSHKDNSPSLFLHDHVKGSINYSVWSDVMICPVCGKEFVFWDIAVDESAGKVRDRMYCPHCNGEMSKRECEKSMYTYVDDITGELVSAIKRVPVLINYTWCGKKFDKKPDSEDIALIEKIEALKVPFWCPSDRMCEGTESRRNDKYGIKNVHQFFTKRNLILLGYILNEADKESQPIKHRIMSAMKSSFSYGTKMIKVNIGRLLNGGGTFAMGAVSGTLYIPSLMAERNILEAIDNKIQSIIKLYSTAQLSKNVYINTGSSSCVPNIPENSIDYIFTDPPFGDNLNYSELNFIWEAWGKVFTNNTSEAIMSKTQRKGVVEYQELMTQCFSENFRILKPGRWMTVEFHNSKNNVWNAIQESLMRVGFIIADVRTLDKKQGSFKQVTTTTAVKQDLVISAYKPKDEFRQRFLQNAGTTETAWDFVRQHLSNIPVVVKKEDKIELISERQGFLLFDRMVAYHIMQGIAVPLDAPDFYKGLEDRFLKRDNMYFLPDQVNEYDMARATCDVEAIQFSLFVSDEKSAIGWLYQQLDANSGDGPQTYQDLMPKFMQELKAVDKREKMPELSVILEENFLKDEDGKWYIPDLTKSGDIAKLREKNLLKEFQEYLNSKGKLKVFRSEAIRAGFAKLWKDKDYAAIVALANRLPEETIQEDQNLLMYYDISLSRV